MASSLIKITLSGLVKSLSDAAIIWFKALSRIFSLSILITRKGCIKSEGEKGRENVPGNVGVRKMVKGQQGDGSVLEKRKGRE